MEDTPKMISTAMKPLGVSLVSSLFTQAKIQGMVSLTTIEVQGEPQEAYEVYSTPDKEQTIGFVFDYDVAVALALLSQGGRENG